MNITEHENNELKVKKIDMKCDNVLCEDFAPPLNSFRSGFNMCVIGPSGSGKTNYLVSLLTQGKKDKKQIGFRNVFNNIFVVSPSLHTLKKNIFEDIDDEWKAKELSVEVLEMYEDLCEEAKEDAMENDEEEPMNLLILDDCGNTIRKHPDIERKLNEVVDNRRHKSNTSIIMLLQSTRQIPPKIRSNMTHLVCFQLKSLAEKEHVFEWTGKKKKYMDDFYDFIFRKPHDTLLIDLTLQSGRFKFYRNFNLLDFK
jgi:DNA replication protein DnaC